MPLNYKETDEFKKDFKKLAKKYKSLTEDFELAKKATIELFHIHKVDNQSVFCVPNYSTEIVKIYKLKKFACRTLKGRGVKSGIRIIYAFSVFESGVVFIEIYFKSDKENEDRDRIREYLKNC